MKGKPRNHRRLTDSLVKNAKPGRYGDRRGGHGLSILVKPTSNGKRSKTWCQRIRIKGKVADIGLGSYPLVSLAMARDLAQDNARRVAQGEDIRKPPPKVPTLAQIFEEVIEGRAKGWRNEKTLYRWHRSLRYCDPISSKPVSTIDEYDVLNLLTPIWHDKPTTAKDLRNHLSIVMRRAIRHKYRFDNPARPEVTEDLGKQTPSPHYPSVKYDKLGTAMAMVRDSNTWWAARYCFVFLVLTGTRSGEARHATWEEMDLDERIWTIPAERMKNGIEHEVPLSVQTMEILLHARDRTGRTEGPIFPPERGGKYMGSGILSELLRRLRIPAVPHGSRQSFRNWAGGKSGIAQPAAEMVLAHQQGPETVRAYLTSTFLEHRGPIMQEWADALEDLMGPVIATTDRENHPYSWSNRTPKKSKAEAAKASTAPKPKKTATQDQKQQRSQAETKKNPTPESPTLLSTEAPPKNEHSPPTKQRNTSSADNSAASEKRRAHDRRRSQRPERKEAARQAAKKRRDRLIAAGLCDACEGPPIPGQTRCEECAEKHRISRRKSQAKRLGRLTSEETTPIDTNQQ